MGSMVEGEEEETPIASATNDTYTVVGTLSHPHASPPQGVTPVTIVSYI